MAVTFFVRRFNNTTMINEYLFVTAETLEMVGDEQLIAPTLPGNNSSTLANGGTNFILNIGSQRPTLRVSGFFLAISKASYPDISTDDHGSGNKYLIGDNTVVVNASIPTGGQEATDIREALFNFWADQAGKSDGTTFAPIELGWPQWDLNKQSSGSFQSMASIASIKYKIWQGQMRQPRTLEVAGEILQYPFSFTWMVGADN